jgi:methylmalonyl-CoA mutase
VKQKRLFEQFPAITTKEWIDKLRADLQGADPGEKLVWKTGEGFDLMPFYRKEDLEKLNHVGFLLPLYLRGDVTTPSCDITNNPGPKDTAITGRNSNSWLIRQDIKVDDYHTANKKALSILMKGVDSAGFILTDADTVNEENLRILLTDIDPECAEINFHPEGKAIEIIKSISEIWRKNGHNLSLIRGAVEADPLIRLIINGKLCIPVDSGFDYLASLIRETLVLENYRCIHINGKWFKNSGSGSVHELAFALSMAVEYVNQMTERGLDPGSVAKSIRFSFGVGSSYFIEIARLRAARLLWAAVCRKFGITGKSSRMEIHCETSTSNTITGDPYMNMIRTQTEAMSAVIGGTDSLTIHPFGGDNGRPGEFPERIARNQQLLLKEEALFDKVADPSAGSYYIETITSLVVENAWKLFLQIEECGGFLAAFNSGLIHSLMSNQEKSE